MTLDKQFSVPDAWSLTTISELVNKLQYGYTAKATYETEGPNFLRITDIQDDGVDWETVPRCEIEEKDMGKYLLSNGDIVFARSGSIEKAWRVENVPTATVFASYLIRGVPLDSSIGIWIKHFLKSNMYLKQIGAASAGIGMKNVNAKKLGAVEIPIPPLNEQNRITDKIETFQTKSKKAKQALETAKPLLDKLRQSMLASAFRGDLTADWRKKNPDVEPASVLLERIRVERRKKWEENELAKMRAKGKEPKDDKWKSKYKEPASVDTKDLPDLSDGWCWVSIGQAFEVCVGATPKRKEPSYWNGDIPWVSSGEVAFCRINKTKENITKLGLANTSTRIHPPGTVLIGMIGEGKTRGQVAILDFEACNNQNSAAIRVSDTQILPEYIYRYLEEQYVKTRTLGSGNNQPALNKTRVQKMMIPIAPADEQAKIVSAVEKQIKIVKKLSRYVEKIMLSISILNNAILGKAFKGELVTQDSSDEPAALLLEHIKKTLKKEKSSK